MPRIVFASVMLLAGCVSVPQGSTEWRGHTAGQLKASLTTSSATLPSRAWVVKSEPERADGHLTYTKWISAGERYQKEAYFQFQEKSSPESEDLGLLQIKDGIAQFCVVNPEHGGFFEGDNYVFTHSFDYCARLATRPSASSTR